MNTKNLHDIHLACIITTHGRVSEASAQMDIIRELWQPHFKRIDIYHEFNGKKEWYRASGREDFLSRHEPKPHYEGAVHLIEQGVEHVLKSGRPYDFIVVASADVWVYEPQKICEIIELMMKGKYLLASSLWPPFNCLATEFFVITPSLADKIFPLNYTEYLNRRKTVKMAHAISQSKMANVISWTQIPVVEILFTMKAVRIMKGVRRILLIPGRKFVFMHNRYYSKDFYSSHHDIALRKNLVSPKLRESLQGKDMRSELLKEFMMQDNGRGR